MPHDKPTDQPLNGLALEIYALASQLSDAASLSEEDLIRSRLRKLCEESLRAEQGDELLTALDTLGERDLIGYNQALMIAEDCAQSVTALDCRHLLLLIPVLCWTRYTIPYGPLAREALDRVAEVCHRRLLHPDARLTLCDGLFCDEHIPDELGPVRTLLQRILSARQGRGNVVTDLDLIDCPPPRAFVDARYLVGVVSGKGAKLLAGPRESLITRVRAQMDACLEIRDALRDQFPGCVLEVQPPGPYFSTLHWADKSRFSFSVRAMVEYVGYMDYHPADLIGVAAYFGDSEERPDRSELRVSLSPKDDSERIIAGVTLVTGPEEFIEDQAYVADLLRDIGVDPVLSPDETFTPEWNEVTGDPVFINPDGQVRSVEWPKGMDEEKFAPTLM